MRAILEAAERVLTQDPTASMEQIAEAAGVARTTVHRRFASRQALIAALADSAVRQLAQAIDDGRPDTSPPLVALHRITANVLRIKGSWGYALAQSHAPDSAAALAQQDIADRCMALLARMRDQGLLDPAADLDWVRRVYYALIGEAVEEGAAGEDPDALATRVVDTLLYGAGARGGSRPGDGDR